MRDPASPPWPYPLATRVLAAAMLGLGTFVVADGLVHLRLMDFVSYWAAAVLAADGRAALAYDHAANDLVQASAGIANHGLPFGYPPSFLLLLLPFALLPFKLAAAAWIGSTLAAFLLLARRVVGSAWPAAAFPPVLINMIVGQSGLLTGSLYLGGALLLPRRPFAAGMLLGCLVVKPQLALPLPFVLLAARAWRTFAGAALSAGGLMLASLVLLGPETLPAMLRTAPLSAAVAVDGLAGWHKMASVYAALRMAGVGTLPAAIGQALAAAVAVLAACRVWQRDADSGRRMAALVAAAMLASPYLFLYDLMPLILPFAWSARRGAATPLLAGLWLILLVAVAQNLGLALPFNLVPAVAAGLLLVVARPAPAYRLAGISTGPTSSRYRASA